ncbi:DUF4065 domain-containing protein [Erwinia tracheiphila]|uniref:Panacea domain-containing protein n=1 Tax=Erwinia tracheiphila TaxID=65700 RepID=UPI001F34026C|nr:type II toxin-antitoxin system antitoxin SocA domain-containing protein [Erwinia tracheiphila]UIA81915.1 DUF4065 domain-containing protein [Erwinia tracheiphila]UIA90510.1 DUF4065 domain-containing protein [Erwinia tracheiphila]
MAYSATAVANAFIEKAIKRQVPDLTPMKLQKLLFYVQSWHLKLYDGKTLFEESFMRWKFGPVIPNLYHELKRYGSSPIDKKIRKIEVSGSDVTALTPSVQPDDHIACALIDKIVEIYGKFFCHSTIEYDTCKLCSLESGEPRRWSYFF